MVAAHKGATNGGPRDATQAPRAGLRVMILPASYLAASRVVGGGERYASEYAKALSDLTPTELGLFGRGSPRPSRAPGAPFEQTLYPFLFHHRRLGFMPTLPFLKALKRSDIVHVCVFPTPLTDVVLALARPFGYRVVLTDVGGGGACWSTYLSKLHPRLNINRLAHGLAHLSRHASTFFADWPQPSTILYGGVDASNQKDTPKSPEGFALFVGRILPHKGIANLIRAMPARHELRILGRPYSADHLDELKRLAQGRNVRFILDADDKALREHVSGANVVVQPSLPLEDDGPNKTELLGLAAIEAMAASTPVIVTRTASLPELVRDGKTGFIVAPNDLEELGTRLRILLESPSLSVTMGKEARQDVLGRFSWSAAALAGLQLYERLIMQAEQR